MVFSVGDGLVGVRRLGEDDFTEEAEVNDLANMLDDDLELG